MAQTNNPHHIEQSVQRPSVFCLRVAREIQMRAPGVVVDRTFPHLSCMLTVSVSSPPRGVEVVMGSAFFGGSVQAQARFVRPIFLLFSILQAFHHAVAAPIGDAMVYQEGNPTSDSAI